MKKRILFIGGTKGGGVAAINNEVREVFAAAGYRCGVLDTKAKRGRVPALFGLWKACSAVKYLYLYVGAAVKIVFERPAVAYLQASETGYLHQSIFLLIAKAFRRETIAHFHAGPDFQAGCTRAQLGRILFSQKYTDKMIVLTKGCRDSLSKAGWKKNIYVIPNFINTRGLPTELKPARERSQLLYVGRMNRDKGIFDVLDVADRLPEERFVFVGGFDDQRTRTAFTRRLEMTRNATWLGPLYNEEKFRVIAESRLLIFPTRGELFPVTLVECSILGCVPLVNRVGCVDEVVKDNFNGFYISPGDVDGIVEKIVELRDGEKVQRLSDNGMEYARSRFTNRAVEDQLLRIAG